MENLDYDCQVKCIQDVLKTPNRCIQDTLETPYLTVITQVFHTFTFKGEASEKTPCISSPTLSRISNHAFLIAHFQPWISSMLHVLFPHTHLPTSTHLQQVAYPYIPTLGQIFMFFYISIHFWPYLCKACLICV